MNSLKKLSKTLIVLLIFLLLPASSYAIVDFSVYGGYSFIGEIKDETDKSDVNGWQYGCYGHINSGIPMLFTVGIGGFYQISPLTIETDTGDFDATRTSYGIDGYAQIDLPFLPVFPYIRLGVAVEEEIEIKYAGTTSKSSEYFKSYYGGVGLSYPVADMITWDIQIFAEYLYTTSKQEDDVEVKGNAVNIGIKITI